MILELISFGSSLNLLELELNSVPFEKELFKPCNCTSFLAFYPHRTWHHNNSNTGVTDMTATSKEKSQSLTGKQ